MSKRKICYVVTISITVKAFFIKQLEYLANCGWDVTVVCSNDDTLHALLGAKIRYVPIEIPRGISFFGSIKAIINLYRFFKKEKFDLIQYSTPNAAFYASIAAKCVNCKIRNYHLMGFRYLGASGVGRVLLKWMEKIACINSTSIECVSESNMNLGIHDGIFKKEKATVVWNGSTGGIDLKRFDSKKRSDYRKEIREVYGLNENEFVFGFVGRITKDKGVNEVLEAFTQTKNAKLFMIGGLEGVNTLEKGLYEDSLENKNIIYTGEVVEIEKYFAAIDVLLLPSYREGFGNVIIEAAAMGTPAIISNIPGPIDAVEKDKTAFIVPVKDVKELLNAMNEIQNINYLAMGKYTLNFVKEKFDSEILCEKIEERKTRLLSL